MLLNDTMEHFLNPFILLLEVVQAHGVLSEIEQGISLPSVSHPVKTESLIRKGSECFGSHSYLLTPSVIVSPKMDLNLACISGVS